MDVQEGKNYGDDLRMVYSDYNRPPASLQEILRFISSPMTSSADLAAIRNAVQEQAKQLAKRGKRGRPRAWYDTDWIQKATTAAFRKRVLGWSWSRVTESMGLTPTRPNIRTVQRREARFAEFIFNAIPPLGSWEKGQFGVTLRQVALDDPGMQSWLSRKTGLPFPEHPEACKKIVRSLAPLGVKPAKASYMRRMQELDRRAKRRSDCSA
jgi:hypothetical protein